MKTTVIYHSADFDGEFCHRIARKFLGETDVAYIGWDFGDAPLDPGLFTGPVYVLDLPCDRIFGMEFPPGQAPETAKGFERFIWIDHHKSSIESHPKNIPGYRIDGVAACRLAWQWFATQFKCTGTCGPMDSETAAAIFPVKQRYLDREVTEPMAVRLAGEYDIWDKRDPRAEVFQLGLRSRELSDFDWSDMLNPKRPSIEDLEALIAVGHKDNLIEPDGTAIPATVHGLLDAGRVLQRYVNGRDAAIIGAMGFLVEFEGLKFLALNSSGKGSLQFAARDIPETGHEALLKFNWTGKEWDVSLYHAKHRTDLDLSAIAVKHGGGGHRGACGFRADKLPFLP